MVMGYFFCLSAAFVLAKFVRDNEMTAADGRVADPNEARMRGRMQREE